MNRPEMSAVIKAAIDAYQIDFERNLLEVMMTLPELGLRSLENTYRRTMATRDTKHARKASRQRTKRYLTFSLPSCTCKQVW